MTNASHSGLPPSVGGRIEGAGNESTGVSFSTHPFLPQGVFAGISAPENASTSRPHHTRVFSPNSSVLPNSTGGSNLAVSAYNKNSSDSPQALVYYKNLENACNSAQFVPGRSFPGTSSPSLALKDGAEPSSSPLLSPMLAFSPNTVLHEGIPFFPKGVPPLEAYARKE